MAQPTYIDPSVLQWENILTIENDCIRLRGGKPRAGRPGQRAVHPRNGLGWPWVSYLSTEHWAALVNDGNKGLGVYNGGGYRFIGGFFGEKGTGGPKDVNIGYINPVSEELLDRNIEYTYPYSLIVGSVENIRRTAAELTDRAAENTWRFAHSRCHFTYRNIADAGWPVGDCLDFAFDSSSALVSPTLFCGAVRCTSWCWMRRWRAASCRARCA